ncbi:MAG: cation:proton antiporter [Acidimicrobiia bacterium]
MVRTGRRPRVRGAQRHERPRTPATISALVCFGDNAATPLILGIIVVEDVFLASYLAGLAAQLGVSHAIGAFMAGAVLAGTAVASRVRALVMPLRDAFAALFLFAFGMSIDPGAAQSVINGPRRHGRRLGHDDDRRHPEPLRI